MTALAATITEALADPNLLGHAFAGASWDNWRTIMKGAYALPMTADEIAFFRTVAERDPPARQVRELIIIAGRRAGKDSIASAIAAHAAGFRDYRSILRPGERTTIACLACDREQASIVLDYTKAFFASGPLASLVVSEVADGVELSTGARIEVATNSFRHVRGRSYPLVIFDEVAYWRDESSATPDKETYRAIIPGLTTVPGAMLVMISSPYRKSGLLWEKYRKHFGKEGDVLVIVARSKTLNPMLDQSIIDEAIADDPEAASAEWLAQFRSDIAAFVERAAVEALVPAGRFELPRMRGVTYLAFTDPSGGSSDSFTLAIGHRDKNGRGILDMLREVRPPFSPEAVVAEFAALLKAYGVRTVRGDHYAGEWPRERFREHGIEYQPCDEPKSDLYRDLLPLLNSARVALLDVPRLVSQLCNLERRTSRAGRDSIDHPAGSHDDVANCCAGVLVAAAKRDGKLNISPALLDAIGPGRDGVPAAARRSRAARKPRAPRMPDQSDDRLGRPALSADDVDRLNTVGGARYAPDGITSLGRIGGQRLTTYEQMTGIRFPTKE